MDLCEEGDVDSIVVSQAMGQRVTPLAKAFPSKFIQMVAMATKFPPEFLKAVEEQTVTSGMGEDLDSAPMGDRPQVPCKAPVKTAFPQPGGFHDLLNAEFPETPDLDATAVRIQEFLAKGVQRAFEQEIHDFQAEREDLHEDMKILHSDRVDLQSIDGMVEESIVLPLRMINYKCWEWSPHWLRSGTYSSLWRLDLQSLTHHVVSNSMSLMWHSPINT